MIGMILPRVSLPTRKHPEDNACLGSAEPPMVHSVIIIMTIDLHELAAGLGFSQLGEESSPY